jgi:hypothetical protein
MPVSALAAERATMGSYRRGHHRALRDVGHDGAEHEEERRKTTFFLFYSPDMWVLHVIGIARNLELANVFQHLRFIVKLLYGGAV